MVSRTQYGGGMDHLRVSIPGRPDRGISGEMKGAVHRAESQRAGDGGAEKERG
jgi:hypothetical protein